METVKKRLAEFSPERLIQARRANGWTGVDLGLKSKVTRQAIYSFEKGNSSPSAETLRVIARELGVEPRFLTSPLRSREKNEAFQSSITFRTLVSSSKRSREQTRTYLEWLAGLGEFVEQFIELPKQSIPDFGIDEFTSLELSHIEEIATETRRFLGLGDGPISDLTLLLENKGVLIGYVDLAPGMDGVSAWIGDRPTVVINAKAFWARARYDLAHELAHLVLHRTLTDADLETKETLKLIEDQAQYFAGCFLMPEATFARDVYALDQDSLVEAKKKWGVSIQAILMRLKAIGSISAYQLARAFQLLSSKSQRRKEPLDGTIKPERARLLKRAIEFMKDKSIASFDELIYDAIYPRKFMEVATGLVFATSNENVVPFKLRATG
jgi:Zn-dependent peptidase ImmA (M78 family)/DNA-binding XRE family transcriptional regulator